MCSHDRRIVVDLQLHSTYSDGTDEPAELVRLAAQRGLRAIALTDHDSVLGVDEALAAGRELGVEVVPALELSTRSEPERDLIDIDVLGYWVDPHHPELQSVLDRVMAARREQKLAQIERLRALGFSISAEEVLALAGGVPGRPHIADVLWRRNPGRFQSRQQIFEEYLSPGGKAYVSRSFSLSVEDAIEVISTAGGIPVLAHPGLYRHIRDIEGAIRRLRAAGLKGLEVWYPYHRVHSLQLSMTEAEAMIARFRQLAKALGLVSTGGSDYHGARLPQIHMGECGMTWAAYQALKGVVGQDDESEA